MKILLTSIFLIIVRCSAILAQVPAAENAYSESVPYQPDKFVFESSKSKNKKRNNEKEDKKTEKNKNDSPQDLSAGSDKNLQVKGNYQFDLPVTVSDNKGNATLNLKKEDFKVFVDNEEKEIQNLDYTEQPLNLILILDVSPSTQVGIKDIQNYALNLVNQLKPQEKVLVIEFDDGARILSQLTDNREDTKAAINVTKFGDGTSLYDTVQVGLQKRISLISGRKIVVLITDGVDTTSRSATLESSLFEAEKNSVVFFPVYLDTLKNSPKVSGNWGNILSGILSSGNVNLNNTVDTEKEYARGKYYLNELAKLSGGKVIAADKVSVKGETGFESYLELLRKQYVISFQADGTGNIGQRRQIKVRINRPDLSVQTKGSYITGGNSAKTPLK